MNVRNDLKGVDVCVKDLRKHIDEGKNLYGQCVLSYKYLIYFENQVKDQMSGLDKLTTKLQIPKTNIEGCGTKVEKIHNTVRGLDSDKEKVVKRFSTVR